MSQLNSSGEEECSQRKRRKGRSNPDIWKKKNAKKAVKHSGCEYVTNGNRVVQVKALKLFEQKRQNIYMEF